MPRLAVEVKKLILSFLIRYVNGVSASYTEVHEPMNLSQVHVLQQAVFTYNALGESLV